MVGRSNMGQLSDKAKEWQATREYPGIDKYEDIVLKKGTVLARLEPGGNYFTTVEHLEKSGYDSRILNEGLQIAPYKNPVTKECSYRNKAQMYVLEEDMKVAYGQASANTQYGKGGFDQIYIPNANELIDKGLIRKQGEPIGLKNYKLTEEEYRNMKGEKLEQHVRKVDKFCYLYEKSILKERLNNCNNEKEEENLKNNILKIDENLKKLNTHIYGSREKVGDVYSPTYDDKIAYLERKINNNENQDNKNKNFTKDENLEKEINELYINIVNKNEGRIHDSKYLKDEDNNINEVSGENKDGNEFVFDNANNKRNNKILLDEIRTNSINGSLDSEQPRSKVLQEIRNQQKNIQQMDDKEQTETKKQEYSYSYGR